MTSEPTAKTTGTVKKVRAVGPFGDGSGDPVIVRVGKYTRRSTDDEHQPYSLEGQDARLDPYIDSQPGWELAATFTDDASGASSDRPGLKRALAAARAGAIDVLLVYRVDRFTRNLGDLVALLDELDKAGVVFRSATEPFDTSTPMGRMLVQMLGMFAQFERETIIDRVIAGMERKAERGKWKGGRPRTATPPTRRPRRSSWTRPRRLSCDGCSASTPRTGTAPGPSRTSSTTKATGPRPRGPPWPVGSILARVRSAFGIFSPAG